MAAPRVFELELLVCCLLFFVISTNLPRQVQLRTGFVDMPGWMSFSMWRQLVRLLVLRVSDRVLLNAMDD